MGKIKVRFMTQSRADADKWITVHPHGGTGTPALLGEDGTVKGGMGGKFNGMNIKNAHGTKKFTSGETNAETQERNKSKSGFNVISTSGQVIGKHTPDLKPKKELSEGERNNIARSELLYKKYGSQDVGGRGIFKEKARSGELDYLHEEHLKNEADLLKTQKESAKQKSDKWKENNLPRLVEEKRKRELVAKKEQENKIARAKEYLNSQTPQAKAERNYLNVPYSEKESAKANGAKWDADKKKWYHPGGELPESLKKYTQQSIANTPGVLKTGQSKGYPTSGIISADDPSIYGHELLGYEGESWASFNSRRAYQDSMGCLYTKDEIAQMDYESQHTKTIKVRFKK